MKSITRVFALALLLALVCCGSALAADQGMTIKCAGPVELTKGQTAPVLTTKIKGIQGGTVEFTLTDTVKKTVVCSQTKSGVQDGDEITWAVPYYDTDMNKGTSIRLMRAAFVMDGKTYTCDVYYTYSNKNGGTVTVEGASWYYNNTACSFGPAFRDVRPSLTEKWYLFTPVDLTVQGRQTFEYIASNMYVIGEVYVDVREDSVTVTYHNFCADQNGKTETLKEFFTFFPDLGSVKDVEPGTMGVPGFQFGQTISIENDLAGDTNVLLFIRNRVNYCTYVNGTHKLTRFWPNLPERKDLRQRMMDMMDL